MVKLKQISTDALKLKHHRYKDFVLCSWQKGESTLPMLFVRLLQFMLSASVFIWSVIYADGYYLIYLTNWGLLLLVLMVTTGMLISLIAICKGIPEDESNWFTSWYWLIYNTTVTTSIFITIFYWVLLYEPYATVSDETFWLDVFTHGFNSVVVLTEVLTSRVPQRILHFYQPVGLGLLYLIFSIIYYAAGGVDELGNSYIYWPLDWRTPGDATTVVAMSLVGVIVIHIFVNIITVARNRLSIRLVRKTSHELAVVPECNTA